MIYILTSWGRWDDEVLNRKFSTEEEAVSVMEKEYNIWNVSKNTENECTKYYAKIIEGDDIYFWQITPFIFSPALENDIFYS